VSTALDRLTREAEVVENSIDLRRVQIADEVTIRAPDGTTSRREMNFNPFDLPAAHIFKIQGNEIHVLNKRDGIIRMMVPDSR
jgi:hypothetical protein